MGRTGSNSWISKDSCSICHPLRIMDITIFLFRFFPVSNFPTRLKPFLLLGFSRFRNTFFSFRSLLDWTPSILWRRWMVKREKKRQESNMVNERLEWGLNENSHWAERKRELSQRRERIKKWSEKDWRLRTKRPSHKTNQSEYKRLKLNAIKNEPWIPISKRVNFTSPGSTPSLNLAVYPSFQIYP